MRRRLWQNDEDFIWAVEYIRRAGYEQRFAGRVFVYYDIAEHQYFPCDGSSTYRLWPALSEWSR